MQDWNVIPAGGTVAKYRILSKDKERIKAEIYDVETEPLFIEGPGTELPLVFEALKVDRSLFFISTDYFYRMMDPSLNPKLFDRFINFLAGKTFLLSLNRYSIDIGKEALLYQYSIVINIDRKNISIEN